VLETGLATYADVSVICGAVERDPGSPTHVVNPTMVVEVLSSSTEDYDRGEKREQYQRIPALREYVLVAQDSQRIEVWRREAGGEWSHSSYEPGDAVVLDAIGCRLDVSEVYAVADVHPR